MLNIGSLLYTQVCSYGLQLFEVMDILNFKICGSSYRESCELWFVNFNVVICMNFYVMLMIYIICTACANEFFLPFSCFNSCLCMSFYLHVVCPNLHVCTVLCFIVPFMGLLRGKPCPKLDPCCSIMIAKILSRVRT